MTPLDRQTIAMRAAQDIPDGAFVNLGIGMPTLVASFLPAEREVFLHSENGLIGVGPRPAEEDIDPDLIDAGKSPITMIAGSAIFDSSLSFSMMRGGHLDIAILGAFEVSERGDLANWWTARPGETPAVGGAMDLAYGARSIWVLMDHVTKDGRPRIVETCSYPLTARGIVKRIYTSLAVIDMAAGCLLVREMIGGMTFDELQSLTGAPIVAAPDLRILNG